MRLEVIAQTVEDAVAAERGGADRIELVRDLDRGGLTPPLELVDAVLAHVRIPVRVMLREQEPFVVRSLTVAERLYTAAAALSRRSIDGLVLGFLDAGAAVDEDLLGRVLASAPALPATFHRAFEDVADPAAAASALRRHSQVDRVLLSGGSGSGAERLTEFRRIAALLAPVRLLAAVGQDLELAQAVARDPLLGEVHVGRAARVPETHDGPVNAARVRQLADALRAGSPIAPDPRPLDA